MPFSPSTYLTSQGWNGPGSGLRKGSIKKPITVAHKTNTRGLGKDRDTSFNWWDDVFSMVAKKGTTEATSSLEERRKTSTGIYSPRPPSSIASSGMSTPSAAPVTSTATFHVDIIGQAKLEAARREFYSKFLRGQPLAPTADRSKDVELAIQPIGCHTDIVAAGVRQEIRAKKEKKDKKDKDKDKNKKSKKKQEPEVMSEVRPKVIGKKDGQMENHLRGEGTDGGELVRIPGVVQSASKNATKNKKKRKKDSSGELIDDVSASRIEDGACTEKLESAVSPTAVRDAASPSLAEGGVKRHRAGKSAKRQRTKE